MLGAVLWGRGVWRPAGRLDLTNALQALLQKLVFQGQIVLLTEFGYYRSSLTRSISIIIPAYNEEKRLPAVRLSTAAHRASASADFRCGWGVARDAPWVAMILISERTKPISCAFSVACEKAEANFGASQDRMRDLLAPIVNVIAGVGEPVLWNTVLKNTFCVASPCMAQRFVRLAWNAHIAPSGVPRNGAALRARPDATMRGGESGGHPCGLCLFS